MVEKLSADPRRKFIWAEVSFFAMWWAEQSLEVQQKVKKLLTDRQLEIVTGGWVMNDEANSYYFGILEQLILGHEWLKLNLDYKPKYTPNLDHVLNIWGHSFIFHHKSHTGILS
jgi:alpha-mannosidase II